MFKMSIFVLNTSSQVWWPLVSTINMCRAVVVFLTTNYKFRFLLMSELWHSLILLGVFEVFWFYATLIIFVDNNNNNNNNQSATASGCTTHLQDVRGLPLPERRSSESVSCTYLNNFFIPLRFLFYQEIPIQSLSTVASLKEAEGHQLWA